MSIEEISATDRSISGASLTDAEVEVQKQYYTELSHERRMQSLDFVTEIQEFRYQFDVPTKRCIEASNFRQYLEKRHPWAAKIKTGGGMRISAWGGAFCMYSDKQIPPYLLVAIHQALNEYCYENYPGELEGPFAPYDLF